MVHITTKPSPAESSSRATLFQTPKKGNLIRGPYCQKPCFREQGTVPPARPHPRSSMTDFLPSLCLVAVPSLPLNAFDAQCEGVGPKKSLGNIEKLVFWWYNYFFTLRLPSFWTQNLEIWSSLAHSRIPVTAHLSPWSHLILRFIQFSTNLPSKTSRISHNIKREKGNSVLLSF